MNKIKLTLATVTLSILGLSMAQAQNPNMNANPNDDEVMVIEEEADYTVEPTVNNPTSAEAKAVSAEKTNSDTSTAPHPTKESGAPITHKAY